MASLTNGWKLFSAAALTAAMLFTEVPAKAEAIPDGGTFTVTWAQNPVSLNPGLSSGISSGIPGAQLFASPLQYDDQWNPHPYLAEKWEMAPDGLSLTLHLVKGAKFHDGTPITSEDVAFSIMAIKANHPFKAMYAPVSGVDTPDPYTAVIRLSKPHPAILLCMSPVLCPIMPKHVYGTDPNIRQNPANKAPIERFITRFARYYTPAVVFIAALVAVIPPLAGHGTFDEWLYRALVLLVISCPCALVISIPLGYFGGIGAASKKGILVKGGHVLDALHNIKTVAFDKTGTLTRGVFEVTRVLPAEGASEEDVLNAARLVESRSTHPIARAIMKTAPGSHGFALEAVESKEIPGKGLSAEHKGRTLLVGNALLLQDAGISVPSLPAGQGSVVYVAVGNAYLGAIEVSDVLRPESAPAIESLRGQGIERLVMLTGDRPESAAIVAKELHLDEYRAGLLPEGKAAELESLGPRQSVLFVGDGINDAPVLAMSGVGVAMGGLGSEAAIEVADAVILDDSPSRLPEMFSIAAKTRVVVWQNIVMALGIKGLFMVLGVVGLSGLWEAVFADVGVALLAVLNATRTAR